jgi:hypothetical protein
MAQLLELPDNDLLDLLLARTAARRRTGPAAAVRDLLR